VPVFRPASYGTKCYYVIIIYILCKHELESGDARKVLLPSVATPFYSPLCEAGFSGLPVTKTTLRNADIHLRCNLSELVLSQGSHSYIAILILCCSNICAFTKSLCIVTVYLAVFYSTVLRKLSRPMWGNSLRKGEKLKYTPINAGGYYLTAAEAGSICYQCTL
jgi:hypothetical protein